MCYRSKELTRFFYKNANVVAVDMSSDAIEYGTKTFPEVIFVCHTIKSETPVIDKFNIILLIKFYPFTRASDSHTHLRYIKYLKYQLNAD